tara:strand:+ start:87 stop:551 length:465 start_codon:yes stop_codon:yes gene_type:complete
MNSSHIERLIEGDIKSLGCDIWGVEFTGKANNPTLRIYIDKDEGVSIQDCEKISKHISKVLDTKFSANENYFLEVSSPGLERKFFKYEQYLSFIGSTLKIRYLENNSKFKTDKGKLKRVSKEYLYLENDEQEFEISFDSIQRANLEFIGEQNAK